MIGSTMGSKFTEQPHVSPKPVRKHIGIIVSRRYAVVTKPANAYDQHDASRVPNSESILYPAMRSRLKLRHRAPFSGSLTWSQRAGWRRWSEGKAWLAVLRVPPGCFFPATCCSAVDCGLRETAPSGFGDTMFL